MKPKAIKGSGIIWRTINGNRIPLVMRDGKVVPKGGPRGLVSWWQRKHDEVGEVSGTNERPVRLGKGTKVEDLTTLMREFQDGKIDHDEFNRRLEERNRLNRRMKERESRRWAQDNDLYEREEDYGDVDEKAYRRTIDATKEWFEKHVGSADDPRFDQLYEALTITTDAESAEAAKDIIGNLDGLVPTDRVTRALALVTRGSQGSDLVPIRLQAAPKDGSYAGSYTREAGDRMGVLRLNRDSQKSADSTMYHELGHHLENANGRLQQAAWEFLRSRMPEGAGWTHFKGDPGAGPDRATVLSMTFPNAYTAKVYPGWGQTEVTSTGIEKLAWPNHFRQLAKDDPEHFFFTLAALRGSFGQEKRQRNTTPTWADALIQEKTPVTFGM